jgi:ubiquitin carboxyl-terminal hydrolase 5/13
MEIYNSKNILTPFFLIGIPISIPDGPLTLDKYLGTGQQANEELLPESAPAAAEPTFDQGSLDQLLAMGFPENRCKRAMMNTGNSGAEAAMNWLFEHMEDPGMLLRTFRAYQ